MKFFMRIQNLLMDEFQQSSNLSTLKYHGLIKERNRVKRETSKNLGKTVDHKIIPSILKH